MDSPLLKLDLGLPPGFALESRIPEDVLVHNSFVQRNIHRVSEGNTTIKTGLNPPLNQGRFIQQNSFLYTVLHLNTSASHKSS